ncbi:MAG TPA: AI-2E family transporter [Tepidisphaeraceae bacterium]|nr:AI-2E family transporter [Tepidisphaeraceae bacterium]
MPRNVGAPRTSRFVLLASICVVIAALYLAQEVLIPLALAMLLSFLMAPIAGRLERWRFGRIPSVLVVVMVLFAAFAVLGYVVGLQLYDLAANIDKYRDNITAKVERLPLRKGGVLEKLQEIPAEVQKKIDQPQQQSTTQTSQPSERAAEVIAQELSTRTGDPRTVTERSKPTAQQASNGAPTTQWTKENPLPVAMVQPKASPLQTLGHYLGLTLGPLGTLGIVIVFVIFMLLQREDLRNRLIRLIGGARLTVATTALDDASGRIQRYLLAQAIVNGTYGCAIALGLWIIGATLGQSDPAGTASFPNVILWGLLCAVLRFIPYIGPWIAAAFPLLISLAVYKGMGVFVATGLLFVGIELASNNFMEPWLYGTSTGMSTVAILVSAVFWTWLWGPIGLLLATPLTVVLVVLGKYVPQLQFLDVLLGDEPVLDPPTRIYQRMLALDADEAMELAEQYLHEGTLESVYDDVLLPALAMAEQDRHKGLLDDRRQGFIRGAMRDMIEELGDQERIRGVRSAAVEVEQIARGEKSPGEAGTAASSAREGTSNGSRGGGNGKSARGVFSSITSGPGASGESDARQPDVRIERAMIPKGCTVSVVCLPAHDEADEICNLMLAQLLELRGYCTYSISQAALASEMIGKVEEHRADVVVVSALPPAAVAHSRYLCKRVHVRFPEANMAVGIWAYKGELRKAKERITCIGSVQLATSLADMQRVIDQLAQPAMIRETR